MVSKAKVVPLKQGEISAPKGVLYMLGEMDILVNAPVFIFYIEAPGKNILVDAGIDTPDHQGLVHGFPVSGGGLEGTKKALQEVGKTPEDIDAVILTHLHFDHVATLDLFKHARIYVQKKEWESALNPVPVSRLVYEFELFGKLERMDTALLEGRCQIAEGVSVFPVPGHTLGQQAVAVDTEMGRIVLAGDLMYSSYNLNPVISEMQDLRGEKHPLTSRPDVPFLPPGIHINLTEWYDSAWKVVAEADGKHLVLPGHEPSLVGKEFG